MEDTDYDICVPEGNQTDPILHFNFNLPPTRYNEIPATVGDAYALLGLDRFPDNIHAPIPSHQRGVLLNESFMQLSLFENYDAWFLPSEFTIEMWICHKSAANDQTLFVKYDETTLINLFIDTAL